VVCRPCAEADGRDGRGLTDHPVPGAQRSRMPSSDWKLRWERHPRQGLLRPFQQKKPPELPQGAFRSILVGDQPSDDERQILG
jgi:hypothetical protein